MVDKMLTAEDAKKIKAEEITKLVGVYHKHMANVSYFFYKEENTNPKLITFYKDNVQLGNPSSGIKHPE